MLTKPCQSNQNPKLSNSELASGSSNTVGGACSLGICPPDFISLGTGCDADADTDTGDTGRSATTSELLRFSSLSGSISPPSPVAMPVTPAGWKNSQFRT
jgi:hypothetical protein